MDRSSTRYLVLQRTVRTFAPSSRPLPADLCLTMDLISADGPAACTHKGSKRWTQVEPISPCRIFIFDPIHVSTHMSIDISKARLPRQSRRHHVPHYHRPPACYICALVAPKVWCVESACIRRISSFVDARGI